MLGTRVDGKYELAKVLGQGAMGVVYRARHATTGREVALKLLHPGKALAPQALERFQREARAMGTVADSPHAVQVLDAGLDPTTTAPYIVMELLSGEDLEALLSRLGPLPVPLALRIVAQALTGLLPAHDKGIVHRDLKPSNLYVMRRPDADPLVKVLDFGIAKMRHEGKLTATDSTLGSPAYMSPEQVRADKALDVRSDLWSMGVVLYQLISGALPFEADQLHAMLLAILNGAPVPLSQRAPWTPPEVIAIVERAMQRAPDQRFQSAREMRDAVVRALGGGPSSSVASVTAIAEGMLIPLSAAERTSGPSLSGLAVSVAAAGGATLPIAAVSASVSPSGAFAMSGGATQRAAAPSVTQQTQPLSAMPSSAFAGTGPSPIARAHEASAGPGAMEPARAQAPAFALPTQPSAGVAPVASGASRVGVWVGAAGLLLAFVVGAAAWVVLSKSAPTAASSAVATSTASPAPPGADDAGVGSQAPSVSPPPVNELPDAGTGAPDAGKDAPTPPGKGRPGTGNNNADPFKGSRTGK